MEDQREQTRFIQHIQCLFIRTNIDTLCGESFGKGFNHVIRYLSQHCGCSSQLWTQSMLWQALPHSSSHGGCSGFLFSLYGKPNNAFTDIIRITIRVRSLKVILLDLQHLAGLPFQTLTPSLEDGTSTVCFNSSNDQETKLSLAADPTRIE